MPKAQRSRSADDADLRGLTIPPELAKQLRCPQCTSPLRFLSGSSGGRAARCRNAVEPHEYPVIDGVPVLLDPEQSVFDQPVAGRASLADPVKTRLPSLGANREAERNYRRFADLLLSTPARPKVLVLGGARLGAGLEAIIDIASIEFVESDVYLGPRTSLVSDAHWVPFDDASFDGVIAQAVIEHVADPHACAAEIHRVLKPRGLVYADTPFMQQLHAGAYDFTRFTHLGQRRLFRKFDEVSSGPTCGPGMALAWALSVFLVELRARAESSGGGDRLRALDGVLAQVVRPPLAREARGVRRRFGLLFHGDKVGPRSLRPRIDHPIPRSANELTMSAPVVRGRSMFGQNMGLPFAFRSSNYFASASMDGENRWLPRKWPANVRRITTMSVEAANLLSREAAAGTVAQGGAKRNPGLSRPHAASPERAAGALSSILIAAL